MPATRVFPGVLIVCALCMLLSSRASGQLQWAPLGKQHLPPDRDSNFALAVGDVDGDGDLDIVLGNDGQNRLYLNDGKGIYADVTAARMPVDGDYTQALVLGDVDGDGDLDLVCGNVYQDRLYLNDGKGTYTDVTAARMPVDGDASRDVALGDVDRDGDLDIVFAIYSQNRLYLNDGKGTFTDATAGRMPAGKKDTAAVAFGDVDGDGDLDLVCGNGYQTQAQNRLYLNDGKGTFTDATSARMPVVADNTRRIALGDVDGDGDLDMVVGNCYGSKEQNRLHLNDGGGTFTDATAARMPSAPGATRDLALGDVDGDGDLDLVAGNDGQDTLWLNDGKGTFTDATATRVPVAPFETKAAVLADVDGDGDLDLVVGEYPWEEPNRLYLNDGKGAFTDATATPMPNDKDETRALTLGDVDGDADLDLVVANDGQNRLYLNDGKGRFEDATVGRLPVANDSSLAQVIGDVDGDGDLDIVWGNGEASGPQNRLCLNDGRGFFTDVTTARMPVDVDSTAALALGDVDGDGDLDLVCGNASYLVPSQNRLYLNDGKGTFTDMTATRLPTDSGKAYAVALGDVDGDGDADLVVGKQGQNKLYLNDGKGFFTDVTASRFPVRSDYTAAMVLGDVDGDGDLDLVFGSWKEQDRLYLNDGKGTFIDATTSRMPVAQDATVALAVGDVDGDGDLDLVLGNQFSQNKLYLNDGKGAFTDASAARMPVDAYRTESAPLGDVDGDGDLDLVCGNYLSQNRLYLNLLRHVDAPRLAIPARGYQLDFYFRPALITPLSYALPFLAIAEARIPLPPFGTLGLDPAQMLTLPLIVIPPASGLASVVFPIPNDQALVGLPAATQALIIPDHPMQTWRLSNVNTDTILRL